MSDGWGALLVVAILAAAMLFMEWRDKRRGRYPRDWRD